jgi:hypothetical protein
MSERSNIQNLPLTCLSFSRLLEFKEDCLADSSFLGNGDQLVDAELEPDYVLKKFSLHHKTS